jgi:hypothetical protein
MHQDKIIRNALLWLRLGDLWGCFWTPLWSLRQESNLYLPLRRRPFYPLNYGGNEGWIVDPDAAADRASRCVGRKRSTKP